MNGDDDIMFSIARNAFNRYIILIIRLVIQSTLGCIQEGIIGRLNDSLPKVQYKKFASLIYNHNEKIKRMGMLH